MTASYSQKLKDPRWQKLRLEVLSKAGFACAACGDTKNELHVHHRYYEPGAEPWEYPVGAFYALCADCHAKTEATFLFLRKVFSLYQFHEIDPFIFTFSSAVSDHKCGHLIDLKVGSPLQICCNALANAEPKLEVVQ